MCQIELNPYATQPALSEKINISLGIVNYALNTLIARGWVKLKSFQISDHKMAYTYILMPEELSQKAIIAKRFWVKNCKNISACKLN